ncbi:MAG: hypothetical protein QJR09_05320 [Micrococcus sp.]|nr:hypothetical protein [Micrococcus sp.]
MLAEETRDEILRAAVTGEDVLVVCDTYADATAALDYVAAGLPPELLERVRRTNGAQELQPVGGGRVLFRSVRSRGGRGLSVDLVVAPFKLWDELRDELEPCLAVTGGSVHLYCGGRP